MADVICNTSPFQYLHQLGCLDFLPALAGKIIAPVAVRDELRSGRSLGYDVPEIESLPWVDLRQPEGSSALPLAADLGPGESAVLALALEIEGSQVIIDDALGRRIALLLGIRLTGTASCSMPRKQD